MKTHTRHADEVLSFGLMLACAAAVTAAIGWQAVVGFAFGVAITLVATAIAGTDFD
jgi:hypothetical protein